MSLQITVTEAVTNITSNDAVTIISEQVIGVQGPQGIKGDTGNTGATGPKGDTGATGPANTLSIGTVSAGSPTAATITGTAPNQTLNLTLPISTFVFRGAWNSGTSYNQYDLVTNRGKTWYAKLTNTGSEPLSDSSANWGISAFGYTGTTTWTSGNFYYIGDTVTDNGSLYYCSSPVSTLGDRTTNPGDLPSKWLLIAAKGATGAQGPAGDVGLYYQLTSDLAYGSAPTAGTGWSPFSTSTADFGVTLDASSAYMFEGEFKIACTSQATAHTMAFRVRTVSGAATDCDGTIQCIRSTANFTTTPVAGSAFIRHIAAADTAYASESSTSGTLYRSFRISGLLGTSITGGKFAPQFWFNTASSTPTILAGSYWKWVKIPSLTNNGTWS